MNPLITEDERQRLLAHGQARAEGQAGDPLPVVRVFTPDAYLTWLLASLDPADGDAAYTLRPDRPGSGGCPNWAP